MHFYSHKWPSSSRVYHPVLRIGDYAHLRRDYYCSHLCLCQICLWIGLLSSLPVATLSCMVSRLATNKAITLFFNSWVLDLVWCIGLGPKVLFPGPIVFGFRFFFYYISLRRQFLSFLNIVPISVLFLNPNMDYDILKGHLFLFMFHVIFIVFPRL